MKKVLRNIQMVYYAIYIAAIAAAASGYALMNANLRIDPQSEAGIAINSMLIVLIIGGIFGYSKLVKKKSLDAGGNSISRESKFLLIILLVGMLVFIFYPLIKTYGYNWFVWILVVAIVFLLYRLFNEDKSILNSDKDE